MQAVLERFDSRHGLVGLVIIVSILAGFIVLADMLLSGDRASVWYFLGFVAALVTAFLLGTMGWQLVGGTDELVEDTD